MSRYRQQMLVPQIAEAGQRRISDAKILIVGAGGLGTLVSVYLAASGIGTIGIVDGDRVELSNLARQFLFVPEDHGALKAMVLGEKLREQNPSISINTFPQMLDISNAADLIMKYDIVCDCTDNSAARLLCNRVCNELRKPLVYASVKEWEGHVTVLHHTKRISLEDIFSSKAFSEIESLNCSATGIVNSTCGIAANIQACEAIKIVLNLPSKLDGGILTFNSLDPLFRIFELNAAANTNNAIKI